MPAPVPAPRTPCKTWRIMARRQDDRVKLNEDDAAGPGPGPCSREQQNRGTVGSLTSPTFESATAPPECMHACRKRCASLAWAAHRTQKPKLDPSHAPPAPPNTPYTSWRSPSASVSTVPRSSAALPAHSLAGWLGGRRLHAMCHACFKLSSAHVRNHVSGAGSCTGTKRRMRHHRHAPCGGSYRADWRSDK